MVVPHVHNAAAVQSRSFAQVNSMGWTRFVSTGIAAPAPRTFSSTFPPGNA